MEIGDFQAIISGIALNTVWTPEEGASGLKESISGH